MARARRHGVARNGSGSFTQPPRVRAVSLFRTADQGGDLNRLPGDTPRARARRRKVRPDIGTANAATFANEARLNVGDPDGDRTQYRKCEGRPLGDLSKEARHSRRAPSLGRKRRPQDGNTTLDRFVRWKMCSNSHNLRQSFGDSESQGSCGQRKRPQSSPERRRSEVMKRRRRFSQT